MEYPWDKKSYSNRYPRCDLIYWFCTKGVSANDKLRAAVPDHEGKGSDIRLGKLCFPLSNFHAMKHGGNVSTHTINQLCRLLQCRVQDVMEYIDKE